MPRSPESASTGSPGSRRISANTSKVMPMKVGTTRARRLRRKENIWTVIPAKAGIHMWHEWTPASAGVTASLRAGQIHLVEEVVGRRVHLVADHFLAHRVEAHRVGDGDPRQIGRA